MEETDSVICGECQKGFRHEGFLQNHIKACHDKTSYTCDECDEEVVGMRTLQNHRRKHNGSREKKTGLKVNLHPPKNKGRPICDQCGQSFSRKQNLDRHTPVHQKHDETFICNVCEKEFNRKDNLNLHIKSMHVAKVKPVGLISGAIFEKAKRPPRKDAKFDCEKCQKSFKSKFNLKRHAKKHRSRWTVMRKVRKLLKDSQYADEIGKKWKAGTGNEGIDDTLVETIMSQIPNISNRNLLRTLTILRKRLPKTTFKANLKRVIQERTNLCNDLFETEFSEVLDSNGESINMPITHAKHLNTLILIVCEKRGLCEDDIKIVLGIDGGQSKLICTMAIVPKDELDKKARMAQENVKDRSKSTSTKRCLVIARIDQVPENYTNVTILMSKLNLPELRKDFCVVADLKLVDIMVGIQSTSSMHPCPFCDGHKIDKNGRKTNQKGTFIKGIPRTMENVQDHFEDYSVHPDKKQLMNHASVQFPPIYIHPGQENMTVMQLYPPPQLHCGILGPGNDTMRKLEEFFPQEIEQFYAQHHIKGSGPGGQFNGPTIKKILENHHGKLDQLLDIVSKRGDDYKLFIEHLTNLGHLNNAVNLKTLDKDLIGRIIQNLGNVFQQLQAKFDLSMPLKMHVILHHYMEFFESFGETLLNYSDEVIEAMHSQIRLFEEAHRYLNNKKGSTSHAKMQHKTTVHLNSINFGDR